MKVKFGLISKKVILCNHVNDVIMGDFCEADESPKHDYAYTYRVIRVDKEVKGEDEIHYSFLRSSDDTDEVYDVALGSNALLGKLSSVGDVFEKKTEDFTIRYKMEGLLYTNTPILSGSVLKYMERRNADE